MTEPQDESRIAGALRISLIALVVLVLVALFAWQSRERPEEPVAVSERDSSGPVIPPKDDVVVPTFRMTDITSAAGIAFTHETGAYGERLLPETMGGGVAFLDYDNDDNLDLLLVNSSHWPWRNQETEPATSALYRGRGDGTFQDVTNDAGLASSLYGMGVAAADFDNDGDVDVYLTAVGNNRLLRNDEGVFTDVTEEFNVAGDPGAWSTSAAFLDYDRDGDLDLYVANYVAWSREINTEVDYRLTGIGRAYGPPTDFAGTQGYLFRNDGTRFSDVSLSAGIHVVNQATGNPVGKGLAVHPVDVNEDGWLDLMVANDTVRNFLFINQQDGSFEEQGIELGVAFDNGGMATGAMGVDAAHYRNDDFLALAVGNFANEMSSFYVSRGSGVFSDDAIVTGVGADSRRALTFGLVFADFDLDGRQELLSANGHVEPEINAVQSSQQYAQPLQLFWNCGELCPRNFRLVEESLSRPLVGRGLAWGDIDGDGDLDVVATETGGAPVLLRNDQDSGNHWIGFRLLDQTDNRQAIGAGLTLTSRSGTQQRTIMPSRSYLSQVPPHAYFGLGSDSEIEQLTVTWPDGTSLSWSGLSVDRLHVLERWVKSKEVQIAN